MFFWRRALLAQRTASAKVLRQEQLGVFKSQCDWTEVSKGKMEDEVRKDITQNLLG